MAATKGSHLRVRWRFRSLPRGRADPTHFGLRCSPAHEFVLLSRHVIGIRPARRNESNYQIVPRRQVRPPSKSVWMPRYDDRDQHGIRSDQSRNSAIAGKPRSWRWAAEALAEYDDITPVHAHGLEGWREVSTIRALSLFLHTRAAPTLARIRWEDCARSPITRQHRRSVRSVWNNAFPQPTEFARETAFSRDEEQSNPSTR